MGQPYNVEDAVKVLSPLLKKNKLIIFVGSGMSVPSGLPAWDGFLFEFIKMVKSLDLKRCKVEDIHEIINDAKEEIRRDPIKVASVIKNCLSKCELSKL